MVNLDILKPTKVINSCVTLDQLKVAEKYVIIFLKRLEGDPEQVSYMSKSLIAILRMKRETFCPHMNENL